MLYLQEKDSEKCPDKKELYHEAIYWRQNQGVKNLALKHNPVNTADQFVA